MADKPADVEEYLAALPRGTRDVVSQMRATVHRAVPGLGERISYGIPTFTRDGRSILHIAGWTHHVAVYPVPDGDAALAAKLAPYSGGNGTLKFRLSGEVPLDLIAQVAVALDAQA